MRTAAAAKRATKTTKQAALAIVVPNRLGRGCLALVGDPGSGVGGLPWLRGLPPSATVM